jgi:hypothetical protein
LPPETFLSLGFLAFAAGDAFLEEAARIAEALALETLFFAAILAATAWKPGCALLIDIFHGNGSSLHLTGGSML